MSFEDLTTVTALLFYTVQGEKLSALYYNSLIPESRREEFEGRILSKFQDDPSIEIFQMDDFIIVCRVVDEIAVFIVGELKSNEVIFEELLGTIESALELIFNQNVTMTNVRTHIEQLYLLIDEVIELGYIFEGNGETLASRVLIREDGSFRGKSNRTFKL